MGLALVTAPGEEVVSLDEVRAHLRVDLDIDDDLLVGEMLAARTYLEEICGRGFVAQTWDYTIDYDWPCGDDGYLIEIPKSPLASVTSITYVDGAGATQTLASTQYVVDGSNIVGRIYQAYAGVWPAVRPQLNAITVRFVAGYGAASSVPEPIRQATLLLISHFYANREPVSMGGAVTELPMAVSALIAPYRVFF